MPLDNETAALGGHSSESILSAKGNIQTTAEQNRANALVSNVTESSTQMLKVTKYGNYVHSIYIVGETTWSTNGVWDQGGWDIQEIHLQQLKF